MRTRGHPGFSIGRARNSRDGRGTAANASSGFHRNSAVVREVKHRRADADLPTARSSADRAGDERRRDLAHRSGDSICHRPGTGAHQPVHRAEERGTAAADRKDLASQRPTSARAAAGASCGSDLHSALFRGGFSFARLRFTEPEILHTNLASVILQMKAFGLGEIERFGFIEPPDTRQIRVGYVTLHEIGALLDEQNRPHRRSADNWLRLPVDPRIGRMMWRPARRMCFTTS